MMTFRRSFAFSLSKKIFPYRNPAPAFFRLSSTDNADVVKVPSKFISFPFQYRQEIDIRIDTLTNRGWGIGRYELPANLSDDSERDINHTDSHTDDTQYTNRWVIMVPNVIPGELVRVRVFRNFKNYSEADLVEVLEASSDRVTPKCDLSAECGGCQLQHISIEAQRKWKTMLVEEALEQYGLKDIHVSPCIGTEHTYGYRSKITPHFDQPEKRKQSKPDTPKSIQAIGFQRQTSRQIVDVPSCLIATPTVNREYQRVREELLSQPTDRKLGATLLFREGNPNDEYVSTNHKDILTSVVNGLKFSYVAGGFFQVNGYVVPLMVDHVSKHASPGMTHLVDCYCGSGLFAVSAASQFDRVVGIEISEKAVQEARYNAQQNGVENCEFIAASAEDIFSKIQDFPRETSVVVLDPPRKGCSPEFLDQLYRFYPQRIVYMSCDPTTQARDAAAIIQAGYKIETVQPFDLFPQTRHTECLMILEKHSQELI